MTVSFIWFKNKAGNVITKGCNSPDSMGRHYQESHCDEITILSGGHTINTALLRSSHTPFQFKKPLDKASPVLVQSCLDKHELTACLSVYRQNNQVLEKYYQVELEGVFITGVTLELPADSDSMETEIVTMNYREANWRHLLANTSAYGSWINGK